MHIYISHYQCLVTHWGGVECSRTHYSLPWQKKLRVEMHFSNGKEKQKSILKVAGCMTIWWVRWQKDKRSLKTCDPQMPISLMFIEVATNHIRYCGKWLKEQKPLRSLKSKLQNSTLLGFPRHICKCEDSSPCQGRTYQKVSSKDQKNFHVSSCAKTRSPPVANANGNAKFKLKPTRTAAEFQPGMLKYINTETEKYWSTEREKYRMTHPQMQKEMAIKSWSGPGRQLQSFNLFFGLPHSWNF